MLWKSLGIMRNYQPKYRWKLNDKQIKLLNVVAIFRFVTTDLLAELYSKDRSTFYERLTILEEQGYLLKQYDSTYRIDRRPASYCLAPAGIRALKDSPYVTPGTLLQNYKNKNYTRTQIDDCLQLVRIYAYFKKHYSKNFTMITKYQLDREGYPRPTPLIRVGGKTDKISDYLVDFIPAGTPTWQIKKRLTQHEEMADESEYTYPHVIFIAGNVSTEKRIIDFTVELYDDFKVFTTTLERVLEAKSPKIFMDPEGYSDLDGDEKPELCILPIRFEGNN